MQDNVYLIAKGLEVMAPAYRAAKDSCESGCDDFTDAVELMIEWLRLRGEIDRANRILSGSAKYDLGLA